MFRLSNVLKQLFDDVHRSVGTDFSKTHGEQPIEEVVLWSGGLESRQRAQVLSRVVADTGERQIDQGAVVCLERRAKIEFQYAVSGRRRPVGASGEDFATKPVAFERTAEDGKDEEAAARRRAYVLNGSSRQLQDYERTGVQHVRALRVSRRWDRRHGGRRLRPRRCDSGMHTLGGRSRSVASSESSRARDRRSRRARSRP